MGHHSVVEAKNQLSELIDRALQGENIVITRHGKPIVELKAVRAPRPITEADIAWAEARRIRPIRPSSEDAGTFVSRMRDEDWER